MNEGPRTVNILIKIIVLNIKAARVHTKNIIMAQRSNINGITFIMIFFQVMNNINIESQTKSILL